MIMPDFILAGIASWVASYFLHSTVLIGCAVLIVHFFKRISEASQDTLLKVALVTGIVSSSLQFYQSTSGYFLTLHIFQPQLSSPGLALGHNPSVAVAQQTASVTSEVDSSMFQLLVTALIAVWVLGILVSLILFLTRWRRFRQELGELNEVSDKRAGALCQKLSTQLAIKGRIKIVESANITSPIAMGFSTICLPEKTDSAFDDDEYEAILAHELAHIKRKDPMWLMFFHIMSIAFFFQPLNKLLQRHFQSSAEFLCDALATDKTGNKVALVEGLVKAAAISNKNLNLQLASPLLGRTATITARVQALLDNVTIRTSYSSSVIALVFGLITLCGFLYIPSVAFAVPSKPYAVMQEMKAAKLAEWGMLNSSRSHHYSNMNASNTLAGMENVIYAVNVEFGANMKGLAGLGDKGELFIAERSLFGSQSLHLVKSENGRILYRYLVGDKEMQDERRAEAFLQAYQAKYLALRLTREETQQLVDEYPAMAAVLEQAIINNDNTLSPNMEDFARAYQQHIVPFNKGGRKVMKGLTDAFYTFSWSGLLLNGEQVSQIGDQGWLTLEVKRSNGEIITITGKPSSGKTASVAYTVDVDGKEHPFSNEHSEMLSEVIRYHLLSIDHNFPYIQGYQ